MGSALTTLQYLRGSEDQSNTERSANSIPAGLRYNQRFPNGACSNSSGVQENKPKGIEKGTKVASKRAKKRIEKEARQQERREARKEERRGIKKQRRKERRAERLAALSLCDPDERERLLRERIEIMRASRAADRAKREHVRQVMLSRARYSVCIDLGWNSVMTDRERKSLARQMAYSYSAIRKGVEEGLTPLALSICGLDDIMKTRLTAAASGWETWPIKMSDKSLGDFHSKSKIVYLTHDADHVLEELEDDCVYVVGGIVDRNRLKGATAKKAQQIGVTTARFNIDEMVRLHHGTPVLTVNHCIELLLQKANGMTWMDAYVKVLPDRKGISTAVGATT